MLDKLKLLLYVVAFGVVLAWIFANVTPTEVFP